MVLTHPVQYYSPWFRHIASSERDLALTVLYAASPSPEQQGAGFDASFSWDIPLTAGYESRFARDARPTDRFDAGTFRGIDAADIGRHLTATRPDVVLLPGWQSITLVRALVAARKLGVPVVYRGDTHLGSAPAGWRSTLWRARSRALLAPFSAYLSVGARARDYLMDLGVDHRLVFSAPHAVDNDRFALPEDRRLAERHSIRDRFHIGRDRFVIVFVGKFDANKRPLDLVRAASRLSGPATLLYVGAGPLDDELRREVAALHVDARFAGFVNQSVLPSWYAAADCLALPSDRESWGLVVNEALAAGLPAVVSDGVGCAPDLVDAETGAVFPVGDIGRFAGALEGVRERSAADEYRSACRARVARFNYAAATDGLVRACRSVTGLDRRPLPEVRLVACCGQMVTVTGLERQTFETLRTLRERGALVHTIVNSWEHHRVTPLADAIGASWSVGAYRCALRRHNLTPRRVLAMAVDVVATSAGLLRDARRTRATAVLVPDHVVVLRNAPALAWLRLRGVPIVMGLGNAPDPGRFYRWFWRRVQNALVSRFVANSQFTARELLAHGIPARKVSWVYSSVSKERRDVRPLPFSERIAGRVVYVGQIIPGKGLDLLIEAASLLVARGIDVSVDVVGSIDGWTAPEYEPFRDRVRTLAARPELAGRVRFLGWQEHVMPYVARASVTCAPSLPELREGFGLVNLEAKYAGVPSVVFASGAFPEVIAHRVDGWIATPATAAALAEGLEYFLGDPIRLQAASAAARQSIARFAPAAYADHWWKVLSDGLESPEPGELSHHLTKTKPELGESVS